MIGNVTRVADDLRDSVGASVGLNPFQTRRRESTAPLGGSQAHVQEGLEASQGHYFPVDPGEGRPREWVSGMIQRKEIPWRARTSSMKSRTVEHGSH